MRGLSYIICCYSAFDRAFDGGLGRSGSFGIGTFSSTDRTLTE